MTAELAKISVIVPNFNHRQYLARCLDGIFSQDVKPFEVLFFDDASTDGSIEFVKQSYGHQKSLRIIQQQKNIGACANINAAINEAAGDYIFFNAADDFLLAAHAFRKLSEPLLEDRNLALCFSHPAFVDDHGAVDTHDNWNKLAARKFSGEELALTLAPDFLWMASNTCLFRKAPLLEFGGYVEEAKWYCDWLLTHAVGFKYGAAYIPEALSALLVSKTSYSAREKRAPEEEQGAIKAISESFRRPDYQSLRDLFVRSRILDSFGGNAAAVTWGIKSAKS